MAIENKILTFGTGKVGTVGGNKLMGYKPFDPIQIEGCIVWLNNTEASFIKDGFNKVSQWSDSSGFNNHYTQVTSANQPLFQENGINGQNGVYFSNSANNFLNMILNSTYPQPFTVITVWNLDAFSTSSTPIVHDNVPSSGSRIVLYWTGNTIAIGSSSLVSVYSKTRPFSLIQTLVQFNGASSEVFENGVLKGMVNAGTNPITSLRLGNAVVIGASNRLSGFICEHIVYSRSLSTIEKTQINNYLNTKYGL